jgi:sugar-specific transcriptional regulator TrmB
MKILSKSLLSSLGLNEAEATVYVAALELGESNMQQLARKSGIKRTSIYNFIDELKSRGLIAETKKKKHKVYSAVHPRQLLEIEKTRIVELERTLPELLAIQNKSKVKPRVTFYENIEGIKDVYADMLKEGKEIVAFEDLEHMQIALPKSFYEHFPSERARRGIPFKSILRDSPEARRIVGKNKYLLRQSKLLASADWRTEVNIYGEKVALMSFRSTIPFCVLIDDHDVTETLRSVWQELWERLPATVVG